MKKIIVICGLLLIAFIIFCFTIGYKLPQRDRHKDWTILENNNDPHFVFEPVFFANEALKLAPSKLLMLINANQIIVVDSNSTVLRKFNTPDPVYIDTFHSRLIIGKPAADYASTKAIDYSTYDLKDATERPIQLIDYPLAETFEDFKQQHGHKSTYRADSAVQDHIIDSLLSHKYIAAHEKERRFFAGLHPVLAVMDDKVKPLNIKYYTDDSGKLYDIRPLVDKESEDYDLFMRSMDLLYPAWLNVPDLSFNEAKSPSFSIADKSIITDNDFNFDSGINFNPTGGSDGPVQIYFEQNYLHYYTIRFRNSTAHFKIYDNVHIRYVKEAVGEFMQLNIPSSDNDTLVFIYAGQLYKAYPRSKAIASNKHQ